MKRFEVHVGESVEAGLSRWGDALGQAMSGLILEPLCEIGFETMAQFGKVFTPQRWELVEALKSLGPTTINVLAKRLARDETSVHEDVAVMMEWHVIEQDETSCVFVPWDEIQMRWPLLKAA